MLIYLANSGIFTTRPTINNLPYFCLQTPEIGPCKASIPQYYFNAQLRSCQIFYWGGCAGNQNRFDTRFECERACPVYGRRMMMNKLKQG